MTDAEIDRLRRQVAMYELEIESSGNKLIGRHVEVAKRRLEEAEAKRAAERQQRKLWEE